MNIYIGVLIKSNIFTYSYNIYTHTPHTTENLRFTYTIPIMNIYTKPTEPSTHTHSETLCLFIHGFCEFKSHKYTFSQLSPTTHPRTQDDRYRFAPSVNALSTAVRMVHSIKPAKFPQNQPIVSRSHIAPAPHPPHSPLNYIL